jgi:hypothetical protein
MGDSAVWEAIGAIASVGSLLLVMYLEHSRLTPVWRSIAGHLINGFVGCARMLVLIAVCAAFALLFLLIEHGSLPPLTLSALSSEDKEACIVIAFIIAGAAFIGGVVGSDSRSALWGGFIGFTGMLIYVIAENPFPSTVGALLALPIWALFGAGVGAIANPNESQE